MVVLMDPPEEPGYRWRCRARLVKICSNNYERHFLNAEKESKNRFLYTKMPIIEEMYTFIPYLWPAEDAASDVSPEDKRKQVALRALLVGCAPRHIFSLDKFTDRVDQIETTVKALSKGGSPGVYPRLMAVLGKEMALSQGSNLATAPSKLYNLDGSNDRGKPLVHLNSLARAMLWDNIQKDAMTWIPMTASDASDFEYLTESMLLMGGSQTVVDFKWNNETGSFDCSNHEIEFPRRVRAGKPVLNEQAVVRNAIKQMRTEKKEVLSTAVCKNYPVIDFVTSPVDWFNAKSGATQPKLNLKKFHKELENQGLTKTDDTVTMTFSTLIETPGKDFTPIEGVEEELLESDLLQRTVIRYWKLTQGLEKNAFDELSVSELAETTFPEDPREHTQYILAIKKKLISE